MSTKAFISLAVIGFAALSCTSRNESALLTLLQGGGDITVRYIYESEPFCAYNDGYHESYVHHYENTSYLEVDKNGKKTFYDWNGEQLPISQNLDNIIQCSSDSLGYFRSSSDSSGVTYDWRLNVIFPDKAMLMYCYGDIYVFSGYYTHILYDLNGELIWHCPEGWEVSDMEKSDDGDVTLTMMHYGDKHHRGSGRKLEVQTTRIPLPVNVQHSRFNFNVADGYSFSAGKIQWVNHVPVTDLGLSALWAYGDNYYPQCLFWDFNGFTWDDNSYLEYQGEMFCLPSEKEMKELINKCIWTKTANNGYIVTSPTTGNSIVLGGSKRYWTSTLKKNKKGILEGVCLEFNRPGKKGIGLGTADRKDSLFVRLVTY